MPTCKQCKATFGSQTALNQHRQTKHAMPGQNGGGTRKVPVKAASPPAAGSGRSKSSSGGSANKLGQKFAMHPAYQAGLSWAARCVHPCDENRTGAMPIPDKTSRTTACPEYRFDVTYSAPDTYVMKSGEEPKATVKWDSAVIVPDMVECAAIVYMKPTTVSWDDWNQVAFFLPENAGWTKVYRFAQFPEGTTIGSVAEAWRVTHRGVTMHLDAPEINNTGMVYAQQWPEEWETFLRTSSGEAPQAYSRVLSRVGPWKPQDLVQRSGATYESNAKYGVYVVMYPDQQYDVVAYQGEGAFREQFNDNTANNGLANSPALGGVWYPPPSTTTLVEQGNANKTVGEGVQTAGYKGGFTAGLIYFEGLPGGGGAVGSNANLVLKVRQGVELVPSPTSALAPFTTSPASYNPAALDFVTHVGQSSAMAYPANYNDLSKIWGAIKSGMKKYGMPLVGMAADSGIPIISEAAKIGQGIADFFGL